MSIGNFVSEYWYILFAFMGLSLMYYKILKDSEKHDTETETFRFYFIIGVIITIALIIQKFFFQSHFFFFISMVIFVPVWAMVIKWLLSRDDVYVIESAIMGDTFYDITNVKKITIENTTQRLLIMPREIYDSKKHVGDLHYGFWAGSNRIKFTDYYDDATGIFYHPPIQQLHNFTFYAVKSYWLKLKQDLPGIIDRNTIFTLMSDWYLSFKMDAIKKNLDENLTFIQNQHEHIPFTMPDSLEKLYEIRKREKQRDISQSETRETPPETKSEIPVGGESNE